MLKKIFFWVCAILFTHQSFAQGDNDFHFYVSQQGNFHLTYNNDWLPATVQGAEYALQCNSIQCGITTYIAINTRYDAKMINQNVNHLIETADAKAIVRDFVRQNNISTYNIISSGASTIGNDTIPVFHVQFTYTYNSGQNRMSDLYLTFNKGRYYTLSFLSTPENYQLEKILAANLLATFGFNS